uniref:Uncharacterized protein n=1 Tax=Glycine max TaxID=3847 RepID=I1MGK9_SOYBN
MHVAGKFRYPTQRTSTTPNTTLTKPRSDSNSNSESNPSTTIQRNLLLLNSPIPSSMENPDSSLPLSIKENVTPITSKIAELNESRSELLGRVQSLKQDLQSWRSKLDTQVKVYRDELSELKKTLNVEVDQLRAEFQDLRTTLQQQQEDVTASLRNLGLQDASDVKHAPLQETKIEKIVKEEQVVVPEEDNSSKVAET